MAEDSARLAYDEALRVVESQSKQLDDYRTRATAALTAAAAIAALFALGDQDRSWAFWVALVAFALVALLAFDVHRPRAWKDNPGRIVLSDEPGQPGHADYARWHQDNWETNDENVMNEVSTSFRYLLLSLSVLVIMLMINVGLTDTTDAPKNEPEPTQENGDPNG